MTGKAISRRDGTTAQHAIFTGLPSEITIDTDKQTVVVHDGVTPGGTPLAKEEELTNFGRSIASVSGLLNDSTTLFTSVNVLNYHLDIDGGGGVFYWDASKAKSEHNGGTVIDPTAVYPTDWNNQTQLATWFDTANAGTGCWIRQYDGAVNVKWFGARGDYTGTSGTVDTISLRKAHYFASATESSLFYPKGNYGTASLDVSGGMLIFGEGPTSVIVKVANAGKWDRTLTTQNSTLVDKPFVLKNIALNGNRINQGAYLSHEIEQQHLLFLSYGNNDNPSFTRLSAVVDNVHFMESCADMVSVYNSVSLTISNCTFWNGFRGSCTITGGNTKVVAQNLIAGGDVHTSFFQVEVDNAIIGADDLQLTLSNSVFNQLQGQPKGTGVGLDIAFGTGSVNVSNCVFNAGIKYLYGRSATVDINSCKIYGKIHDVYRCEQITFSDCYIEGQTENTGVSIRPWFESTSNKWSQTIFDNCTFSTKKQPVFATLPYVSSVLSISSTVIELTFSEAHGIPIAGNYTDTYIRLSGFTAEEQNRVYHILGANTPTTLRLYSFSPFVLGENETIVAEECTETTTCIISSPAAASNTFSDNADTSLTVKNCTLLDYFHAVSFIQGNLYFKGNRVNTANLGHLGGNDVTRKVGIFVTDSLFDSNFTSLFTANSLTGTAGFYFNNNVIKSHVSPISWKASINTNIQSKIEIPVTNEYYDAGDNRWYNYKVINSSLGYGFLFSGEAAGVSLINQTYKKGPTSERPANLTYSAVGLKYFDTTLNSDGKCIWWTGTSWVDATGTVV